MGGMGFLTGSTYVVHCRNSTRGKVWRRVRARSFLPIGPFFVERAMDTVTNELFLSAVLGKPVIDQQGHEIGTLWDLAMAPGEVSPQVSTILVKKGKQVIAFPWQDILLFNSFVISI